MSKHALRLSWHVVHALRYLYDAGPKGVALILAEDPDLLEAWGLAEFYTDPTRLYCDRVRITPSGQRIVRTVINPM